MSDFKAKYTKFISARTSPQTLLGELTALPRPVAGFKGPTSKEEEGKEEVEGGEGSCLLFFCGCTPMMLVILLTAQLLHLMSRCEYVSNQKLRNVHIHIIKIRQKFANCCVTEVHTRVTH